MNHSVEANTAKKSNFGKFVLVTLSIADASQKRGAVTRTEEANSERSAVESGKNHTHQL